MKTENHLEYTPPPTLKAFHNSTAFGRFVVGPIGSGKTHAMIIESLRRAREQAPGKDGIRRTRSAIVRNTYKQLKQSVIPDIQQILGPIVRFKVSDSELVFDIPLADGTRVKSEWLLMPLETSEDQRRLLSLQLTWAWLAEFRELDLEIVAAIEGRLGRYPSKAMGGPSWHGIFGETNPFSEGSPWYDRLILDRPKDWDLFRQPSGRSPLAENLENLPPGYYTRLADGRDPEWVRVHIDAEWGEDLSGQAVFRNSFKPDFHVRDNLLPNPERSLLLGVDFGRTPAAVVGQLDAQGRLVILGECLAEDCGAELFATQYLRPYLVDNFPGMRIHLVGDPAGRWKTQASEESLFDILNRCGFSAVPATTNDLEPRLRAVEAMLLRQVDGGPALIVDRQKAPRLLRAMQHEYRYRRKKTGEVEDRPDKTHPWSDIADALQYLCLGVTTDVVGRALRPRFIERRPKPSVAGWT